MCRHACPRRPALLRTRKCANLENDAPMAMYALQAPRTHDLMKAAMIPTVHAAEHPVSHTNVAMPAWPGHVQSPVQSHSATSR